MLGVQTFLAGCGIGVTFQIKPTLFAEIKRSDDLFALRHAFVASWITAFRLFVLSNLKPFHPKFALPLLTHK